MSAPTDIPGTTAAPAAAFRWIAAGIALAELALLREVTHRHFMVLSMGDGQTDLAWYLHTFTKVSLLAVLALLVAAVVERRFIGPALLPDRLRLHVGLLHVASFALLVWLVSTLPQGRRIELVDTAMLWRYAATSTTFLIWQASALALIAPAGVIRRLRWTSLGFIATGMAAAVVLSSKNNAIIIAIRATIETSTLELSMAAYRLFGRAEPMVRDVDGAPVLSASDFAVTVSPVCAGYQGMLAAALIMAGLVMLEWPALRRVPALILGFGTVIGVFLMNAFRIALLLHIGEAVSPEMALDGFHSYFGTLSLLAVVAVAMVALQLPVFRIAPAGGAAEPARGTGPGIAHRDDDMDAGARLVMPLALYLGILMIGGLFVAGFNWLYPVTAAMGLGILYAYRGMIAAEFADGIGFGGFAMGIAVFILWVIVVPADPEGDVEFADTLFAAPPLAVLAWITMRIIGSSVVVPVVEELAFRAGLPILLRGWLGPLVGRQAAAIAAFAASSVAFGILHSDILAGTLAGACYGLLTLRTGRVGDAIVAHAVTNFLICIAVLGTDRWSLW